MPYRSSVGTFAHHILERENLACRSPIRVCHKFVLQGSYEPLASTAKNSVKIWHERFRILAGLEYMSCGIFAFVWSGLLLPRRGIPAVPLAGAWV
jgi:hypothetical protein